MNTEAQSLIDFLQKSPVNFLAVETVRLQLEACGYKRICPADTTPQVKPGDKVYFTKNDSAIFAMHIGELPMPEKGFHLICAHSDSPTFRIKPNAEMVMQGGMVKINTEVYGGAILSTWFDRPLSIAGRVILRTEDIMHPESRLLHIQRPLLTIPNLAIHFNRQVNDGVKLSKQKDMLPILGIFNGNEEIAENGGLIRTLISKELCVKADDIIDYDLYLYDTTSGCTFGFDNEFISAGRLDDLSMVHAGLTALLADTETVPLHTKVLAVFDNEETGSATKQGAGSPFFTTMLQRIILAQGYAMDDFYRSVEHSFMISADNAHGWHPNYSEKYDPTNHPVLGGGPVIKFNAAQKYASDASSASIFQQICESAGVPCQRFVNHSDNAGGSTLGNILTGSLPISGVDMGNPMLAMHSVRETASVFDHVACIKAFAEFYRI